MSAKCKGCGRYIWSARSRAAGRGSGCRAKLALATAAARQTGLNPVQVGKAAELIELGAIVPAGYGNVFRVVSSSGQLTYWASPDGCTCPAGTLCYHRIAAAILLAA